MGMESKYLIFSAFILIVVYVTSCATAPQQTAATPATSSKSTASAPQPAASSIGTSQGISTEVKDLLDKSKTRVKNINYKYRGTQTGDNYFEFYVKDTKVRYKPARQLQSLDRPESYDSIFIDKTAKTAQTYCVDHTCLYKGKKGDLNYADAYISTVFDWLSSITQASKVGEEVIDNRNTWKIETNEGTLWLDTYYGIPLKAESGGKLFRFEQIAPNSVQDSDVTPS